MESIQGWSGRMSAAGRLSALACAALAVCLALDAGVARAANYQLAICHAPGVASPMPDDTITFGSDGDGAAAGVYDGCDADGYIYADLDGTVAHAGDSVAFWRFNAPPGTAVTQAVAYRTLGAATGASDAVPTAALESVYPSGASIAYDSCSQTSACPPGAGGVLAGFDASESSIFSGPGPVTTLEGIAECDGAGTCAAGSGGGQCPELGSDPCIATNHIYALIVTLEDDTAPTASALGGSLIEPETLSGTVAVAFEGQDTGSGLASAAVSVDGAVVATSDFGGDPAKCDPLSPASTNAPALFAWSVPCPLIAHTELSFDTAKLADGVHAASVSATDAAGNVATVWSGTIRTANTVATPRAAAGSAKAGTGPAGGRASGCRKPKLSAQGTQEVRLGQRAALRGMLRCGRAPIAGARLTIASRALGSSGGWKRDGAVSTGRDGSFSYTVGGGPSRRVLVSFHPATGAARASASVMVAVIPPITLTVTPARTTNGHTITFRGRVGGGHQPAGGVPLDFEYLEAGRWMTYDVVHTDPASGRYSYSYTFRRTTEPITYTFRFALPASGVERYPFAPSASPARSVHVDP
ncbi:MAG TPA: hypothetical protein VHX66_11920 [Solirubrobacteraceae bacterium]|jgi:hypothetical protein|nr:hypothetical protein [Solirubrobacteraceae bacterium]